MGQPTTVPQESGFVRGLNLFDATMVVIGVMIGSSGIFIVTADNGCLVANSACMAPTATSSLPWGPRQVQVSARLTF
jgi:hypothetical protein